MATYCPCGCGKKLGRGEAKYLRSLDERIEFFEAFNESGIPQGDDLENGREFVEDGRGLRAGLIDVVHGADPATMDRDFLRAWIKYADKTQREITVAMKRAGALDT